VTKWKYEVLSSNVRAKQLGFRGRKVINCSHIVEQKLEILRKALEISMSQMRLVRVMILKKVILSVGTNDVKYNKFGVGHLRRHISDLIDCTLTIYFLQLS
jgi:hypothetical protein